MTASVWNNQTIIPQANATGTIKTELHQAIDSQRVFNITSFAYALNTGSLLVFKNGELLGQNNDYVEVTPTSILLSTPAAASDIYAFIGFIGITGTVASDNVLRQNLLAALGSTMVGHQLDAANTVPILTQKKLAELPSVKDFGAVGDGVTDDTLAFAHAFAACKVFTIPGNKGETYKISKYPNTPNVQVIGLGSPQLNLFLADTPVMVQFGSNSKHSGIKFNSTMGNLPWQRATVEGITNLTISHCGFYNFKDLAAAPNSWGLYIANSKNVLVDNCDFSGNSQSDIALTDNNTNITIIHPTNTVDGGVYLDAEPNGGTPNNGTYNMNVLGGNFRQIDLLENDATAYGCVGLKFSSINVTKLRYSGSGAQFDDTCIIGSITNGGNNQYVWGGNLNISIGLSRNLVDDPYMLDMASANPTGQWTADYISNNWAVARVKDEAGSYTKLNATNINQCHWMKSKKISVITGTNPLLLLEIKRSQIPVGAGWVGRRTYVEYFTNADVSLGYSYVYAARGKPGTTTPMMPHWGVLIPPAGTSYVIIHFAYSGDKSSGGATSTICDHEQAFGLFEISDYNPSCNTREIASRLMLASANVITRSNQVPPAGNSGAFIGDVVLNSAPAVGSPRGWFCSVSGTPATYVSQGNY